ncbi:hypothetical protein CTI14_48280, partial [Methylobacterium radiotolerans]
MRAIPRSRAPWGRRRAACISSKPSAPRAPSSLDELEDAPAGRHVVFSAHGVSKAVRAEAESRGLQVFDATCPLVT